ncbi:hypothetical protein K435DRAFT_792797 [Dendrothele bispora CBS 962.96]|uniref:Uncharacterized protein n=1 Tax=Dendrothele bispora (strain CBS 962.96) TaxID=1314807 RepID=A0A4S8MIB9_DENBC|nr:hypothetical protein K435DRAFT_792797 [Dendrothele bispora CBS 962.96]
MALLDDFWVHKCSKIEAAVTSTFYFKVVKDMNYIISLDPRIWQWLIHIMITDNKWQSLYRGWTVKGSFRAAKHVEKPLMNKTNAKSGIGMFQTPRESQNDRWERKHAALDMNANHLEKSVQRRLVVFNRQLNYTAFLLGAFYNSGQRQNSSASAAPKSQLLFYMIFSNTTTLFIPLRSPNHSTTSYHMRLSNETKVTIEDLEETAEGGVGFEDGSNDDQGVESV